jgi:hypothetical protein
MAKFAVSIVAFALLAVTLASANYNYPSYTPLCGACGKYFSPCVSGTTCKNGKCTQEGIEAGKDCSDCKLCKNGLDCKNGKCTTPPPQPSACGKSCSAPGATCVSGLTCEKGVCQQLGVDVGHECSDCRFCKDGLECKYGKCAKKQVIAKCGEMCAVGAYDATCEPGTYCSNGKCIKYVGKGSPCGGCNVCSKGLKCNSYGNTCVPSYRGAWY